MKAIAMINAQLLETVGKGDVEQMSELLDSGADVNFRDVMNGSTCLHQAAANGHVAALHLLLKAGADPNIVTQNTSTSPLGIASLAGHRNAVELLMSNGAQLSNDEVVTGLIDECRSLGHHEIAAILESGFRS